MLENLSEPLQVSFLNEPWGITSLLNHPFLHHLLLLKYLLLLSHHLLLLLSFVH